MNKKLTNRILSCIGIIVLFLALSYSFVPEVLSGKIVNQSDISGYIGMSHEMNTYNAAHPDDPTAWTNSMFSGMPTTSISAPHQGDWTQPIYDFLLTGKRPATYLFISLLGAFLLMLSLGVNSLVAIGGAIAITFCSYNIQIIQVGHNTKMQAIAFLPWVLAALVFTYRSALSALRDDSWKKWLPKTFLGAALFALAMSFQVKANHQQITYYLAIMIFVYVIVLIVWLLSDKERRALLGRFVSASVLLLVLGCAGIATNANKLIPLYDYTEHTMRGGSELTSTSEASQINSDGLSLDYATNWSYGWNELPNMLIPDFNGGSSAGAVNPSKSETYKLLKQAGQSNAEEICQNLPLYWGPQPFTAGPMYMGAVTIFLFILGLFLYKGKEKWWIIIATLLAVFLAVGSHWMWFTKIWFDHVPFYNKFRTVSMALIVLQFTLPMLGFLVLDRIIKGSYSKSEFRKASLWSLGIAGGFCLLCILLPGVAGSFTGSVDEGQAGILTDALKADRKALLVKDSLTSLIFICLTFALLWWASSKSDVSDGKTYRVGACAGVALLIFINMFAVGKRYLSNDDFTTPRDFSKQFTERGVDKIIFEDKALDYRVVDLSVNVFNDAHASYWHKNIGGYSPAKLQRYQDLIDRYLVGELNSVYSALNGAATVQDAQAALPVLPIMSALNCKYIIVGADVPPVVNENAFGNAWFVDSLVRAATPDEEIALTGSCPLASTAVIGADFEASASAFEAAVSATGAASPSASASALSAGSAFAASSALSAPADTIFMTSYAPNELRYHYRVSSDRPVIFSEVYYPEGWHAYLDNGTVSGKKDKDDTDVDLFRADWILRGAVLPSGENNLIMRFEPKSYQQGILLSRVSSILVILILIISAGMLIKR